MNEMLQKAESALKQVPGLQYLYDGKIDTEILEYLLKKGWAFDARDGESIQVASMAGMDRYDIYYSTPDKDASAIEKSIGKCRFVATSLKEMELINEAAAKTLDSGHLEVIGLTVIPPGYDDGKQPGFRKEELSALSIEARKLRFLSIRGCFVRGNTKGLFGESLGRYLRDCYETAKQVTTTIPCGMSYVNMGSLVAPICQNIQSSRETLEEFQTAAQIMVNQNQTAFYAKLLIQ